MHPGYTRASSSMTNVTETDNSNGSMANTISANGKMEIGMVWVSGLTSTVIATMGNGGMGKGRDTQST